jgi:hypothetical protein
MGREKEPFRRRRYSQDRERGKHEDAYGEYEDDPEYDEDVEEDEYEDGDEQDVYEKGSHDPRRRSTSSLPPFPTTTRNIYPRTKRASRMPGSPPPTSSKRPTYLPQEPQQPSQRRPAESYQQPSSRRSTGSYQRPSQRTMRTDADDLPPRRPVTTKSAPLAPRKRRIWPIFLIGCLSGVVSLVLAAAIFVLITIHSVQNGGFAIPGIVNTAKPYTQQSTQTASLSFISQVIVCDSAGNASLKVDPNVTSPTVVTTKTVHAANQTDANQQLRQITVDIQPPGKLQKPLACQTPQTTNASTTNNSGTTSSAPTPTAVDNTVLTVNVTFPPDQTGETVDVAIALPPAVVQSTAPTNTLISIEAPLGNITIDGVSGLMSIKGFSGNITVQNAELVDGSRLETEGDITFNGFLDIKDITHKQPNQPIHYILSSGHLVDVTLSAANTNIMLDVNTNVGKIVSDFPIKANNNSGNGAASYNGPLNANATTDPNTTPLLTLNTSTGNVYIHKK